MSVQESARADADEDRLARAALSRCSEPEDAVVGVGLAVCGAARWWEIVRGSAPTADEREAIAAAGEARHLRGKGGDVLTTAKERLATRAADADPARDLANAARLGGGFVVPGDAHWPAGLAELDEVAPLGLWWRGAAPPPVETAGWGAVVGTRDPSAYGLHAANALATQIVEHGGVVVSGGALGVDAAAHRAAMACADPHTVTTVCVLAGGVDRLYPAANTTLLKEVAREHLVLSEHPPGCTPTRWRFLSRNRLIAALAAGCVVVEGRWRSGSLSTAHRAAVMGRWVGAVPGPVTSATSEGPHRLIREGAAELVSRPEDVLQGLRLMGAPSLPGLEAAGEPTPRGAEGGRVTDQLDEAEARLWESLPLRRSVDLDRLLAAAGLAPAEALAALQRLRQRGLAATRDGTWRRSSGAE